MSNPYLEKLMMMSEEEIASIYKTVFSSPEGKLCLQDIRNRSYRDAPVALDTDTKTIVGERQIYLNAGMQLLCLHIEGQIEYKPEQKKEFQHD